jgi:pSer/pThr/pTyr-binding forkhead associated (FHA) protein
MQPCPNCGYTNRPGVVFCENCGTSLIGAAGVADTRALIEKAGGQPSESLGGLTLEQLKDTGFQEGEEFPESGFIQLEIGEGTKPILVLGEGTIMFGRRDAATGSIPGVDLTPFAGYRMGVSRRHAEIRVEEEGKALYLWDLGSSNGTFINGDRLISHRPYRLKDGDQVRFGQLMVLVRFRKKDSMAPANKDNVAPASETASAARAEVTVSISPEEVRNLPTSSGSPEETRSQPIDLKNTGENGTGGKS